MLSKLSWFCLPPLLQLGCDMLKAANLHQLPKKKTHNLFTIYFFYLLIFQVFKSLLKICSTFYGTAPCLFIRVCFFSRHSERKVCLAHNAPGQSSQSRQTDRQTDGDPRWSGSHTLSAFAGATSLLTSRHCFQHQTS